MGLQDRDYMHERADRGAIFTPPQSNPSSVWFILSVLVLSGLALFKGYAWLLERETQSRLPSPSLSSPDQPETQRPATNESKPSVAPPAQWVRCTVNGQTLYTEGECPGTTQPGRGPAIAAPRSAPAAAPSTATPIYHCKDYEGKTFWAGSHCNQHRALVDRVTRVPGNLPFEQQVQIADKERRAMAALGSAPSSLEVRRVSEPDQRDPCKALDERIEHLDSIARQPQSGQMQDWLRGERKQARDRQFALRC